MQRLALNTALKKAKLHHKELDCLFAGDLMNQCTGSTFGLIEFETKFLGLFGACSTMAEGLIMASVFIDSGHIKNAAAVTSSHFCTAERQFRFPLEYGSQRSPTSQWTATAAGAFILSDKDGQARGLPVVKDVMIGTIKDMGIKDAANMGAAMAPAAADTLLKYFRQTGYSPKDFDLIATGDLGSHGLDITNELLKSETLDLGDIFTDCGLLIYAKDDAVKSGGSGCGCSASVGAGYIMKKFESGEFSNVLFIGTGALMSPGSVMQGNSIPGVAHLVHIERN